MTATLDIQIHCGRNVCDEVNELIYKIHWMINYSHRSISFPGDTVSFKDNNSRLLEKTNESRTLHQIINSPYCNNSKESHMSILQRTMWWRVAEWFYHCSTNVTQVRVRLYGNNLRTYAQLETAPSGIQIPLEFGIVANNAICRLLRAIYRSL